MRLTTPQALTARWHALATPTTRILIGLMAPSLMVGMDHHVFAVALPTIRAYYGLDADMAAWASIMYSLPFMALMPLYGRLGDGLGKRRLLLAGMICFLCGGVLVWRAPTLTWFMIGRVIQGIGSAGFVPLGIAIVAQWFAATERGKVLGAWNSVVPLSGLLFPYFGGLLIDSFGWRAIYPPILLTGLLALWIVQRNVPTRGQHAIDPAFLRTFDWTGVILLTGAMVALLFFTSSRPITGVDGLRDWRLLVLCLFCFGGLYLWERQRAQPYINLALLGNSAFTAAAFCAGLRMLLMSSISFVLPLYLADIHGLNASLVGLAVALQAGMLFLVSRLGGQLADRWGSRRPVLISMVGLIAIMAGLALAPAALPVWLIFVLAGGHGLVIGLSLAPLHRAAMHGIPDHETGAAAGIYSMVRFAGQILGVAVAGVALQANLAQGEHIAAFQLVFWFYVAVALAATILTRWVSAR